MTGSAARIAGLAVLLGFLLVPLMACRQDEAGTLPSSDEVRERYTSRWRMEAEISGNVAVLRVYQPYAQIRRGGELWAKVGPYIFLFSPETRGLFEDFGGLAAVRVVTLTPGEEEIARATLERKTLNDITWRRALNISGKARTRATERPSLLSALIRWGEDHTTYEYNDSVIPG